MHQRRFQAPLVPIPQISLRDAQDTDLLGRKKKMQFEEGFNSAQRRRNHCAR
jgi:hypothetical protein